MTTALRVRVCGRRPGLPPGRGVPFHPGPGSSRPPLLAHMRPRCQGQPEPGRLCPPSQGGMVAQGFQRPHRRTRRRRRRFPPDASLESAMCSVQVHQEWPSYAAYPAGLPYGRRLPTAQERHDDPHAPALVRVQYLHVERPRRGHDRQSFVMACRRRALCSRRRRPRVYHHGARPLEE